MRHLILVMLTVTLAFGIGCESRETRSDDPLGVPRAETEPRLSDHDFVRQAVSTDLFEIQAAQLAYQKDIAPATEEFVEMIAADHAMTSERLTDIAVDQGISMPEQMIPRHQQLYDELEDLEGDAFEQRFREIQLAAHNEAVELYERAARELETPELREFARQHVSDLREHREMARDLQEAAQP